jgi:hypothetical protein
MNEGNAIGAPTFSFRNFCTISPRLLEALVRPDYWGLLGSVTICSLGMRKQSEHSRQYWFYAFFAAGYFCLYSSHYRSIFQVRDGDLEAYEMLRYSLNIFPCAVGMLCYVAWPQLRWTGTLLMAVGLLLPALVLWGVHTRRTCSKIEEAVRFNPLRRALKVAEADDVIVTDTPMCARLIASPDRSIWDRSYLTDWLRVARNAPPEVSLLLVEEWSTQLSDRRIPNGDGFLRDVVEQTAEYRITRLSRSAKHKALRR